MTEEMKNPGHTYFQYENDSLFGAVEATVKISACNFPIFRKDASIIETATEGEGAWEKAMDRTAIALTVATKLGGNTTGGTIILTEEEQDKLILGILERRGHDKISGILDKITNLVPSAGIEATSGVKSTICPAKSSKLPGEEGMTEANARQALEESVAMFFGKRAGGTGRVSLRDIIEGLGRRQ